VGPSCKKSVKWEWGFSKIYQEPLFFTAIRCIYERRDGGRLALVTIRVPEKLRREMRKVKSVNWSALIRDAIEARLELERRRTRKDWERIRETNKKVDALYEETQRKYGHIAFNSAETIRFWREMRSRGTSQTPQ
jgi:hypothetical protein